MQSTTLHKGASWKYFFYFGTSCLEKGGELVEKGASWQWGELTWIRGEFTKTLRKVCTCQKLKFSFLLLEYCKIRECYAVANAFTIRSMYSLLLYLKRNSRKINRPTKNMTKMSCISKLLLTKMQVKFSIFFNHGSLNVIGDQFRFVRSKLKSR